MYHTFPSIKRSEINKATLPSKFEGKNHSIANSSLFPTFMYLHSNSTQILALKKQVFSLFRVQKIKKKNFCKKGIM